MNVEIWADVACPWCYIGKRRFEAALELFEGREDVDVTWRSFELDPQAPAAIEGDLAQHLAEKYGMSREDALARHAEMTELAKADGIDFRFDLARRGNTFDSHRLIQLGAEHGIQDEVEERMMRAQHSEGELISSHEVLQRLAVEAGLPADEVAEVLAGDRFAAEVREDERVAGALGISGVPFFVVDRKYGASGAQPAEALAELLDQAAGTLQSG